MHTTHIASWAAIHERMNTYHATRQISKITLKYLTSFGIFLIPLTSNGMIMPTGCFLTYIQSKMRYYLLVSFSYLVAYSYSLYYIFICIAICDYLRFGKHHIFVFRRLFGRRAVRFVSCAEYRTIERHRMNSGWVASE